MAPVVLQLAFCHRLSPDTQTTPSSPHRLTSPEYLSDRPRTFLLSRLRLLKAQKSPTRSTSTSSKAMRTWVAVRGFLFRLSMVRAILQLNDCSCNGSFRWSTYPFLSCYSQVIVDRTIICCVDVHRPSRRPSRTSELFLLASARMVPLLRRVWATRAPNSTVLLRTSCASSFLLELQSHHTNAGCIGSKAVTSVCLSRFCEPKRAFT